MKTLLRTTFAVLALALATPMMSFGQSCPAGYTFASLPGGGFSCIPDGTGGAPEISTSASSAGLVLVAGIALMIRGRKRPVNS